MLIETIVNVLHRYKAKAVLIASVLFVVGAMVIIGIVFHSDYRLCDDLLDQAHFVANTINVQQLAQLSGTAADLDTTPYLQLKEHLAAIHANYPQCRFIYLLGRKQDRSIFFYADSERPNSEDESPAGQHYDEASPKMQHAFDSEQPLIDGPVGDRWGVWVSALVPVVEPTSGKPVAMLGMDVDVHDWRWNVIAHAMIPSGIVLTFIIGLIAILLIVRQNNNPTPYTVMRRLMPAMTALLLLLIGGSCGMLVKALEQQINSVSYILKRAATSDLRHLLAEQAHVLDAVQDLILHDPVIVEAIRDGNRKQLLTLAQPIFDKLKTNHHITHLFFSDTNRVCILRLHKPDQYGDRIDRLTMIKAEQTRRSASGIELGALGTLPLRVVHPVFDSTNQLVGYMELGKELANALDNIAAFDGVEKIQLLIKNTVDRSSWEAGMAMLGRQANWDLLPDHALVYSTISLPSEIESILRTNRTNYGETREIRFNNKYWRVLKETLPDVSGKPICELIFLYDITSIKLAQHQQILIAGIVSAILLIVVLLLIFVMLYRTDASIRIHQARLLEFKTAVTQSPEGIALMDLEGKVRFINIAWAKMHGYTASEVVGQHFCIFHTPEQMKREVTPAIKRLFSEGVFNKEINHIRKDGISFPTRMSASIIKHEDGKPFGFLSIACDITTEIQHRESEYCDNEIRAHTVNVSARFMQVDDQATFDKTIQYTLATFGQCFHVDHGYFIRFSDDLADRITTHAWHLSETSAHPSMMEQLSAKDAAKWIARMRDVKIVCIPDVSILPANAPIQQQLFEIHGIQSSLSLPIHNANKKLIGAFVFEAMHPTRMCTSKQLDMLHVLMDIVDSAIARMDVIQALTTSEKQYATLFHEMLDGFALHEIICNPEGVPVDYRFIAVNPAFERLTGLQAETVLKRTVLDVLPQTEPYWIETYGRVATTGVPVSFEHYSIALEKYFEIHSFCPQPGQFACIFQDISLRKQAEEELQKRYHELERINHVTVGRELRMIELKAEINALLKANGHPEKYKIVGSVQC